MINRTIVGWREWVALPDLDLPYLKAKIDTGARTSALHAFAVEPYKKSGKLWVRFGIHPHQADSTIEQFCDAQVIDTRMVSDSGGHKEKRYVISTGLKLGNQIWPIEITLTNRDSMRFRMLIGRTAMMNRLIVQPESSYLVGEPPCGSDC
jgi:hypothetical protein